MQPLDPSLFPLSLPHPTSTIVALEIKAEIPVRMTPPDGRADPDRGLLVRGCALEVNGDSLQRGRRRAE